VRIDRTEKSAFGIPPSRQAQSELRPPTRTVLGYQLWVIGPSNHSIYAQATKSAAAA